MRREAGKQTQALIRAASQRDDRLRNGRTPLQDLDSLVCLTHLCADLRQGDLRIILFSQLQIFQHLLDRHALIKCQLSRVFQLILHAQLLLFPRGGLQDRQQPHQFIL